MISVEGRDEGEMGLVRTLHGDENPDGPGFLEEVIPLGVRETLKVARQFRQVGLFARAADPEGRLAGQLAPDPAG